MLEAFFEFILSDKVLLLLFLFFSIIIHELAHGYTALFQGDDTAEKAGRLTLNPIPHISPVGSIFLPGILILMNSSFLFGWAKPVPYNPEKLRNKKWGEAMVAAAGSFSNFILAFICLLILVIFKDNINESTSFFLQMGAFINIFLGIFNLMPVPPLDGSRVLLDILKNINYSFYRRVKDFFDRNFLIIFSIFLILIFLGLFNYLVIFIGDFINFILY